MLLAINHLRLQNASFHMSYHIMSMCPVTYASVPESEFWFVLLNHSNIL